MMREDEIWVRILPEKEIQAYSSKEEYLSHHGKWMFYGPKEVIEQSALKVRELVGERGVRGAKYKKRPAFEVPKGYEWGRDHVLIVYCDDRDRQKVRNLLVEELDAKELFWRYDRETLERVEKAREKLPEDIKEVLRKFLPRTEFSFHELRDKLLSVPEEDYLVVVGYKYPYEIVENWRDQIHQEMKETHGITDNSCLAFLLRYFINWTGPSPEEETTPYQFILLHGKKKGWSSSTIRRNLKKLQTLGVIERHSFNEEKYREETKIWRAFMRHEGMRWRHFFTTGLAIPEEIFENAAALYDEIEIVDTVSFIRGMSEEEIKEINTRKYTIVAEIDLRGLDLLERNKILKHARKTYSMFSRPVQPRTHEERVRIEREAIEWIQLFPSVSRIYKIGSMADNTDTAKSDVDLLVVSDVLPEEDENLRELAKNLDELVDTYFFTPEQYQELIEKRKTMALSAVPVFERDSTDTK